MAELVLTDAEFLQWKLFIDEETRTDGIGWQSRLWLAQLLQHSGIQHLEVAPEIAKDLNRGLRQLWKT